MIRRSCFPFCCPFSPSVDFHAFPQKRTPSGWQQGRLEGGRLAVSANIFSNEISLQCTTSFMVLSFDITASRFFFSAKKYALGESHLACSVSIFVLADESLVSLLCVVAMFDFG